jgi:hypothetical protein
VEPNVLLVVLDSVRSANTSVDGYAEPTTPFLARFADSATHYTQARSPGSWSLPNHISIVTGRRVAEHRVTEPNVALAEEYCDPDDRWQFRGDLLAVYGATDARAVEKDATWDDDAVTVRTVDAGTGYVRARDDGGRVAEAFDDLSDAGICGEGTDVGDATRQRLRDLGYAE